MSEIINSTYVADEPEPTDLAESGESVHSEAEDDVSYPVEPFRLARITAAKNLSAQLQTKHGLSAPAADAIAYAVEDPAEARRQLQYPNKVRVPGGTLRTITARISAFNVVPHLVNGRVVGATPYPASVHAGTAPPKFWAERDLDSSPSGTAEISIHAKTRQQVVDALEIASRELLQQNDLTPSIRDNGIFFPVTVVPLVVETLDDGLPSRATLTAIEGSSRAAATHKILGLASSDPLYGSVAEYRVARGRMQEMMAKLDLPLADVTDDELWRARAASLPAAVVIGYDPDRNGDSLLTALDAYVAFLHLDPPKQWSEPAKENKLADGVIDELAESKIISEAVASWYAGMLSPAEASAASLSAVTDHRAASILQELSTQDAIAERAVARGIKRYTFHKRATIQRKALAAASLALRAHAGGRKSLTTVLGRTWELPSFWSRKWAVTDRSLEEIRDAALSEIAAGGPGPSVLELAARASYYLVVSGGIATEEPGSWVGTRAADKRTPTRVLEAVVRSEQGVHMMYRAVINGRVGSPAPRVDAAGAVTVSAAGTAIEATNAWTRETFRAAPPTAVTPTPPAPTPTMTPEHVLDTALDDLGSDVARAIERIKAAESVQAEEGGSLILQVGIDSPRAREILGDLLELTRKVTRYELAWQIANPDLVGDPTDDLNQDEA